MSTDFNLKSQIKNPNIDTSLSKLLDIRENSGEPDTTGILDSEIINFLSIDKKLSIAINEAHSYHLKLRKEMGNILLKNEKKLVEELQNGYINFYAPATVNPYVAIAGKGPWIITAYGAVLHDNGGYGMLGAGHGPEKVIDTMSGNWVMANVMTPSFSQHRLVERLRKELGHTRGNCPFSHFICMNSGSESVTVSLRIADANSNTLTSPGSRHEGKEIKLLAIEQGFHGRTDRPAQLSHSCKDSYDKNLASFRDRDNLFLVPSNDVDALRRVFTEADKNNVFIELMAIEPVQGEGNPGQCITREFYDEARKLTKEHGSLLLVDSIQAGIRGQGCLSIIDYDGFQDCEVPDLETWSKAMNAGQYPLSVLGMNPRASEIYVTGIYGNTMTTNPRALETAITVLDNITPQLRQNIRDRGVEFVEKLNILSEEFPEYIIKVQGTGLLCSVELRPDILPVIGFEAVEPWCRRRGLGVIHGGKNALRFTPHFEITSEEIDLIIAIIREAIINFTK
ncbi:MAG: aminotransferase class III-fold pyridoxal phosphate-dependent enzyme [Candidatus Poseidoniales archaeon]